MRVFCWGWRLGERAPRGDQGAPKKGGKKEEKKEEKKERKKRKENKEEGKKKKEMNKIIRGGEGEREKGEKGKK